MIRQGHSADSSRSPHRSEHDREIEVNGQDFQENVIDKSREIPVLVDFWAPWCQPCLVLGPILEKLTKQYQGKFILAKVNVQENSAIASRFGISAIPSVKLFKNGKVVDEFMGVLPEAEIEKFLRRLEPSEADLHIKQGDKYYKLNKFSEAIKEYEKTLEKEPGNESLQCKIGTIYFKQGNFAEAKKCLKVESF